MTAEPRPPIPDEVLAERFPRQSGIRWVIPLNVWLVLLSWGLAVLLISALLSWRTELNRQEAERDNAEQRAAMCQLIDRIIGDTPPPGGPAGQRARDIRADMLAYRATLHCDATVTA
jgi:hypothetical protein